MCAKWCVICVRVSSTSFPLKRVSTHTSNANDTKQRQKNTTRADGDNDGSSTNTFTPPLEII